MYYERADTYYTKQDDNSYFALTNMINNYK